MKCFEDVDLTKGRDLLFKSLEEDTDFSWLITRCRCITVGWATLTNFFEYAGTAINCKARLSQAEDLLKNALTELKGDLKSDVTGYGMKLVEMYPGDINAYNNLFYFQSFINDVDGELETLNKALKIAGNPAPV